MHIKDSIVEGYKSLKQLLENNLIWCIAGAALVSCVGVSYVSPSIFKVVVLNYLQWENVMLAEYTITGTVFRMVMALAICGFFITCGRRMTAAISPEGKINSLRFYGYFMVFFAGLLAWAFLINQLALGTGWPVTISVIVLVGGQIFFIGHFPKRNLLHKTLN